MKPSLRARRRCRPGRPARGVGPHHGEHCGIELRALPTFGIPLVAERSAPPVAGRGLRPDEAGACRPGPRGAHCHPSIGIGRGARERRRHLRQAQRCVDCRVRRGPRPTDRSADVDQPAGVLHPRRGRVRRRRAHRQTAGWIPAGDPTTSSRRQPGRIRPCSIASSAIATRSTRTRPSRCVLDSRDRSCTASVPSAWFTARWSRRRPRATCRASVGRTRVSVGRCSRGRCSEPRCGRPDPELRFRTRDAEGRDVLDRGRRLRLGGPARCRGHRAAGQTDAGAERTICHRLH